MTVVMGNAYCLLCIFYAHGNSHAHAHAYSHEHAHDNMHGHVYYWQTCGPQGPKTSSFWIFYVESAKCNNKCQNKTDFFLQTFWENCQKLALKTIWGGGGLFQTAIFEPLTKWNEIFVSTQHCQHSGKTSKHKFGHCPNYPIRYNQVKSGKIRYQISGATYIYDVVFYFSHKYI